MKSWILIVLCSCVVAINAQVGTAQLPVMPGANAAMQPWQTLMAGNLVSGYGRQPTPESGLPGAADTLAFGVGNMGNAVGAGLNAVASGALNSVATLLSGVLGRGAHNTGTVSSL